jgi:hypothetical protein
MNDKILTPEHVEELARATGQRFWADSHEAMREAIEMLTPEEWLVVAAEFRRIGWTGKYGDRVERAIRALSEISR